jgi:hypothetical protein
LRNVLHTTTPEEYDHSFTSSAGISSVTLNITRKIGEVNEKRLCKHNIEKYEYNHTGTHISSMAISVEAIQNLTRLREAPRAGKRRKG